MTKIFCTKLQKERLKLSSRPLPGELGEKIFNEISQEAWSQWLDHQTILINEYRLNLLEPKAREFLISEMKKFLFGEGSAKPDNYSEI